MSSQPLYGLVQAKLQLITHAYFEEKDFSQISILKVTVTSDLTDPVWIEALTTRKHWFSDYFFKYINFYFDSLKYDPVHFYYLHFF